MGDELAGYVGDALGDNGAISDKGVDFQTLYFESVRPKPEILKALEVTFRESF